MTPEQRRQDEDFRQRAPACIFGHDWRIDRETYTYMPPVFDRWPEIMGGHEAMRSLRYNHQFYGDRRPRLQWYPPPPPITDFSQLASKTSSLDLTVPIITFRFERIALGSNTAYDFVTLFDTEGDTQRFCAHMDVIRIARNKRDRIW